MSFFFILSFFLSSRVFQSVVRWLDFEEFHVLREIVCGKAPFLHLLLYWVVASLLELGPVGFRVFSWFWAWIKLKLLVSVPFCWPQMLAGNPGLRCLAREEPLDMESVRSHLSIVEDLVRYEWVGALLRISETQRRTLNTVAFTAFILRLFTATHSRLRRGLFVINHRGG